MKKKFLLFLLPCLIFSGCVSQSEYDAAISEVDHLWAAIQEESEIYGFLMTSFDADLCGALKQDQSMYQIIISRSVEDYGSDLGSCIAEFELMEECGEVAASDNEILYLYVKYVDSEGRTLLDVCLRRNAPGTHFELVE